MKHTIPSPLDIALQLQDAAAAEFTCAAAAFHGSPSRDTAPRWTLAQEKLSQAYAKVLALLKAPS